jgi:riboflavin synthase
VEKGSITVDGVSLTVAATDGETFTVALIPTTLAHTTLGARAPGDTVNLEVDVVAKYVERLGRGYLGSGGTGEGLEQEAGLGERGRVAW